MRLWTLGCCARKSLLVSSRLHQTIGPQNCRVAPTLLPLKCAMGNSMFLETGQCVMYERTHQESITGDACPHAQSVEPAIRPARRRDAPAIAWAEHLPPKLTPEMVQDLVDKFQKNYPGELLGPDSMPSIRLLSMVYEMTKSKHFKWIPRQLRLSARQCQEAVEARSETQLLFLRLSPMAK